ncbi:MAG: hypothetical protein KatS3mg035_1364 [Bacteroidia bacterium]|nr:MAG: hypothetical protein KatS3mg035_1364 [Bacteroidia bacterium]
MEKITNLFISILLMFPFYLQGQMIIPNSLLRSIVGTADNDIKKVIGITGTGSMYNQSSADKNVAASGGFVFSIPFSDLAKEGKFNAFSFITKYNIGALKSFTLKDSIFNITNVANNISKQIFAYDNGNNFNLGLRFHFLNRKDDQRLSNFNFFLDGNITDYKIQLDSLNASEIMDTLSQRNLKLSSGFTLLNPVLGVNYDWSAVVGNQYFGFNVSLVGAASFIYEKDAGKQFVSSWAYTLLHNRAFEDITIKKKINSFYSAFFRFNIFVNDINVFIVLQKNFVGFNNSQLELQGINNRNLFINWGVTFSPSLLHFSF